MRQRASVVFLLQRNLPDLVSIMLFHRMGLFEMMLKVYDNKNNLREKKFSDTLCY